MRSAWNECVKECRTVTHNCTDLEEPQKATCYKGCFSQCLPDVDSTCLYDCFNENDCRNLATRTDKIECFDQCKENCTTGEYLASTTKFSFVLILFEQAEIARSNLI